MRNIHSKFSDKLLCEFDRFVKIITIPPVAPQKPTPLTSQTSDEFLSIEQKKNIQGLMRINHTGEICAQALYYGQALFAKDQETQTHLILAAKEEHDHLYWCQERLNDLNTHNSILNPFWYISSFTLGATAALFGDNVSYGFVIEVEKQVENHLQDHMDQIPKEDKKTHAILSQMQADEIRHGQNARDAGGIDLPKPIKSIMTKMSEVMKFLVYRI
ncbi:MAG: 2-polyprenyl-3-methyl-6-methoxy-1,4-benzoquinone monooxygenase [Marinicellaceae bacterium]